ncbi:MAG: site-specific DNA-methyltransferase [Silvanigrellaceae bacterium]|nr:site-specific DNA-methyltransferase [Silvanigrellaceae bacterium]
MSVLLNFEGKRLAFTTASSSPLSSSHYFPELTKESLDQNILMRGDNLQGLKILNHLQKKFHFIYIDPPYNTGKKFSYQDFQTANNKKSHDLWLSMIFSRLLLTKEILLPNGIFFISIDEREYSYLSVLVHEVFGRENHIGTIKWRKKRKPSFLNKHLSQTIEYILVIAKDHLFLPKLLGSKNSEKTRPVLNSSNSLSQRFLRKGTQAYCEAKTYPPGIYKNRSLAFELLDSAVIAQGHLQNEVRVKGNFRVNQEILDSHVFITKHFGLRRTLSEKETAHIKQATDDGTVDWPTNEDAQAELIKIFQADLFPFSKPVGLILKLLDMYPVASTDTPTYCLDYFAGSGTLAHAVYLKNAALKKNQYHFCCIQDESLLLTAQAKDLRFKTNADITQYRIQAIEERLNPKHRCKIFSL